MRLIDADKLYEYLDNKYPCDKYAEIGYIYQSIERCQTVNAIKIPPNATNGDMIKAIFPNVKYYMYCVEVKLEYHSQYDTGLLFDKKWWNAPYKREIKEKGNK